MRDCSVFIKHFRLFYYEDYGSVAPCGPPLVPGIWAVSHQCATVATVGGISICVCVYKQQIDIDVRQQAIFTHVLIYTHLHKRCILCLLFYEAITSINILSHRDSALFILQQPQLLLKQSRLLTRICNINKHTIAKQKY